MLSAKVQLYSSFCQGEIVVTDIRTAEMTKVVENTFRAVNIAFANELAKICRHDNMDGQNGIKVEGCNTNTIIAAIDRIISLSDGEIDDLKRSALNTGNFNL